MKRFKVALTGSILIALLSILMACSMAVEGALDSIPPENKVLVLSKNAVPDKNKKYFVILNCYSCSTQVHHNWRNDHIPKALEEAGITNYEIYNPNSGNMNVNGDYILKIDVQFSAQRDAHYKYNNLWAKADTSIDDLTGKSFVKVNGEFRLQRYVRWDFGEMVGSLLVEMLEASFAS